MDECKPLLSGLLSPFLGNLSESRLFLFVSNSLRGMVPRELSKLKKLQRFLLAGTDGWCSPRHGPGILCLPRHVMTFKSRKRGFEMRGADDVSGNTSFPHVKGCSSTQ